MEAYFNTTFEDIRHERSPILLLALVEPDILKQVNLQITRSILLKILLLKNYIDNAILQRSLL